MIAGQCIALTLVKSSRKAALTVKNPPQMQPASKNAGGKKLLRKRFKGKDPNSHFETP